MKTLTLMLSLSDSKFLPDSKRMNLIYMTHFVSASPAQNIEYLDRLVETKTIPRFIATNREEVFRWALSRHKKRKICLNPVMVYDSEGFDQYLYVTNLGNIKKWCSELREPTPKFLNWRSMV